MKKRSTLKYKLNGEHQLPFGGIKVLTDDTENAIVQHCIVMSAGLGFGRDSGQNLIKTGQNWTKPKGSYKS